MCSSTVIVCTRNRVHDLITMLASLKKQTVLPNEIIVIDASNEPVLHNQHFAACWQELHQLACLIYHHTTPGLTAQRNKGVTLASGDILYFFDDDVILTPDYLEQMQRAFQRFPAYGGGMGTIAPCSRYKPWVNILRTLFFLQRDYAAGTFTLSGMPTHPYGTTTAKTVEVLGGCCMAFRSSVFKNYQFDEALTGYGYMEDSDFSYRVSRQWSLFFNPSAVLEHRQSPASRDSVADNKAMLIANYTYLFFKNCYPRSRLTALAYMWSVIGLWLEALCIVRNKQWLIGYAKGFKYALYHKAQRPYTITE
jgi:GT2 family glycosyltransferase